MIVKVLGANFASWCGTIVSLQYAKDLLQIVALVGSIAVSAASVWWIRKQSRALDRKNER